MNRKRNRAEAIHALLQLTVANDLGTKLWKELGFSFESFLRYRATPAQLEGIQEMHRGNSVSKWVQGEVPNIDGMGISELRLFQAFACGQTAQFLRGESVNLSAVSARNARLLFPGRKKGHVKALRLLKNYSHNRVALAYCADGLAAQNYHTTMAIIRTEIPEWARWKEWSYPEGGEQ